MSSGSLFYSLFTSFHFFDDYLPILHYRLARAQIHLAVALSRLSLRKGEGRVRVFRHSVRLGPYFSLAFGRRTTGKADFISAACASSVTFCFGLGLLSSTAVERTR